MMKTGSVALVKAAQFLTEFEFPDQLKKGRAGFL
jgi:hypothetical protein